MAIDTNRMNQAIYDALYGAMTGSVPGFAVERSVPPNQAFLTMLMPGTGVEPLLYANALSPSNPGGSEAAARALAELTAMVPALHPVYTTVGRLEDFYEEIVRAEVTPPAPNPAQEAALAAAEDFLFDDAIEYDENTGEPKTVKNAADSPIYKNYKNKHSLIEAAMASYLAEWEQVDQTSVKDKQKWAIMAPLKEYKVRMAYAEFQTARPGKIREAESVLGQASQTSLVRRFAEAREVFELALRGGEQLGSYRPVQAFPANWSTTTNYFSTTTIQASEIHTSTSSAWGSWSAGGGLNLGFFSIGGGGGGAWSNYNLHQDTTNLSLSFSFMRVDIRRPWLKENLFTCSDWDIEGRGKNAYSNGKADSSNQGVFPLLPVAFIVARDIRASANWSSVDRETITRQTHGRGGIRIGPFSFGGGGGSSSTSTSFSASFDGTTLHSPGLQVVGYLNRIMPACPPK